MLDLFHLKLALSDITIKLGNIFMMLNRITIFINQLIYPVIGTRYSRQNYEHTIKLIGHLIENDPDNPLVEIMYTIIEDYEENAAQSSNFNNMLKTEPSQNLIA